MSVTCDVGRLFVAGGMFAAVFCSAQPAGAQSFTLTSATFKDGEMLQVKNAGDARPACVGDNVSPPLAWSNVPEGTKSFAIILTDPEGLDGQNVVHWIAYGIPATVTSFAEGEVSKPSDKFVGGKSFGGSPTYFGPCPPAGPPHHYTFVLIATELEPNALPGGLTREEFLAKVQGRTKGATGLIGLFKKPD
jgi:Raf kinase inhibitor-like YbhB/YbcL family protein